MEYDKKLSFKGNVLPVLCLLILLTGCADIMGPQWLTGEPGPDELENQRVVRKPQSLTEKTWPRLADVPETKPKFSSQNERALKAKALLSDRLQADAEKTKIESIDLYEDKRDPLNEIEEPFSFSALKP